jgi:hypothetical protein
MRKHKGPPQDFPPPAIDASTVELFDKFRKLADPENISKYLDAFWMAFQLTGDEKRLVVGLEAFYAAKVEAAAEPWIHHHALIAKARERNLEEIGMCPSTRRGRKDIY